MRRMQLRSGWSPNGGFGHVHGHRCGGDALTSTGVTNLQPNTTYRLSGSGAKRSGVFGILECGDGDNASRSEDGISDPRTEPRAVWT